eukprot:2007344-Amphidinium_carterae.1
MRYLLSWHASKCTSVAAGIPEDQQTLSSLDYTSAFLNADLPDPNIFVWLGIIPPNTYWLLHKAVYGLREPRYSLHRIYPSRLTPPRKRAHWCLHGRLAEDRYPRSPECSQ